MFRISKQAHFKNRKLSEGSSGLSFLGEKYMKVLLINGSPHKNGTTFAALSEIANTLKEEKVDSEIYYIGMEGVSPCRGCFGCSKIGRCVINDKVNEFVDYAADFDGFIIGSPVHYGSPWGGLISFLDRAFFVNFAAGKKVFEHKPGAAIACARRSGTTATLDMLNKYFTITEMPIISGRYWNMVHGHNGEEARKDTEGMQNLRILARNMAFEMSGSRRKNRNSTSKA